MNCSYCLHRNLCTPTNFKVFLSMWRFHQRFPIGWIGYRIESVSLHAIVLTRSRQRACGTGGLSRWSPSQVLAIEWSSAVRCDCVCVWWHLASTVNCVFDSPTALYREISFRTTTSWCVSATAIRDRSSGCLPKCSSNDGTLPPAIWSVGISARTNN